MCPLCLSSPSLPYIGRLEQISEQRVHPLVALHCTAATDMHTPDSVCLGGQQGGEAAAGQAVRGLQAHQRRGQQPGPACDHHPEGGAQPGQLRPQPAAVCGQLPGPAVDQMDLGDCHGQQGWQHLKHLWGGSLGMH